MLIKRAAIVIASVLAASHAHGQLFGLPIADSAEEGEVGWMSTSGGLMVSESFAVLGGRYSINVMDEAAAFGDIGVLFPDHGDAGFGLQVGGQYTLDLIDEILVDVAPRLTLGYSRYDFKHRGSEETISVWMLTAGGVVSYPIDDLLAAYGFIGINHARYSGRRHSGSNREIDPVLALGVLFHFAPGFSAYAEIMHVDDPWLGLGVRYDM